MQSTQSSPEKPPAQRPQRSQIDWLSVLQFVLSALAALSLLGMALSLFVLSLVGRLSPQGVAADGLEGALVVAVLTVSGLLLIPSTVLALLRIMGRRLPRVRLDFGVLWPTLALFVLLPLVLWLGSLVAVNPDLNWFLLPPLHILAIGLPVLWFAYLAVRGLPLGSWQRIWGAFDTGLVLSPFIIIILELFALILLVIVWAALLSGQPEVVQRLMELAQDLQDMPSPEALLEELAPFILQPDVFFTGMFYIALVVPLIEEFFKPLSVWLLFGRKISPAAGFTAGALGGAGFAFFESLLLTGSGDEWLMGVSVRIATGVVHIYAAGLVGWALANTFRHGRYLRLVAAYILAVSIHGLWNGLSLTMTYAGLAAEQAGEAPVPLLVRLGGGAPLGLILLSIGIFIALLASNRKLRREEAQESGTAAA